MENNDELLSFNEHNEKLRKDIMNRLKSFEAGTEEEKKIQLLVKKINSFVK